MGWLWASTENESPDPSHLPHDDTTTPPPTTSNTPPSDPNPDLTLFLTALRPPPPKSSAIPSSTSTPITPRVLHPTTLSCRAAFDTAFYCASLGGQFTSLYRHGSLRSCSQQWSDFWFCVRTNRGMYSDEEREGRVLRRAVGRDRERYGGDGGLSSEDIWEQRGRMVRGAFGGDYWAVVAEDREKEEDWERR